MIACEMNDFTEFDAFQRCRDFARAIAEPLNGRVFSKDPVLVTHLRKTVISIYSNFADVFERDGIGSFRNSSQYRKVLWEKLGGSCSMRLISGI